VLGALAGAYYAGIERLLHGAGQPFLARIAHRTTKSLVNILYEDPVCSAGAWFRRLRSCFHVARQLSNAPFSRPARTADRAAPAALALRPLLGWRRTAR
jgi:hypothetical protein